MSIALSGDAKIYYEVHGSGPAVLFVHGSGGHHVAWWQQVAALSLGAYCRFDASINERLRELSLLIAARHFDAQYSWNAHHKKAIEAGVSAESVKELAGNEVPHFAHADEQLPCTFATAILRDHFVDQETFDAVLAEWDEAGLVDIIGCLANFSMLAMLLNTFQVDLKADDPEPFPDVHGSQRWSPSQRYRGARK